MSTSREAPLLIKRTANLATIQSSEQANGYQMIAGACKQANHKLDLAQFVKVAQQQASSNQMSANVELVAGSPKSSQTANADEHHHYSQHHAHQQELKSIIRYHQFQSPNLQSLDHTQFDSKNLVSLPHFFPFAGHFSASCTDFTLSRAEFRERTLTNTPSSTFATAIGAHL